MPLSDSKRLHMDSREANYFQETFNVQDSVHGLIRLPKILKNFIDHRSFQRLRYVRQLPMCGHVYPGATHTRFFHSIGTAFLSFSFMRSIRERHPHLDVSNRDILCVTIAGLLHDIGHPCFSHMFETFVKRVGKTKPALTDEQRQRYAEWTHEDASVALARLLWDDLAPSIREAGLESTDIEFVCALIDPPKKLLTRALNEGRLGKDWRALMPHTPLEKGWMFEIVSNWRSGLDTDRFDYFRRDARHCGIAKEFDHWRYMSTVRVLFDARNSVWTLSPPDKDKDLLKEDMFELRRSLHKKAYGHKSTVKLDEHMVDILVLLEQGGLTVRGRGGVQLALSDAAVNLDPDAYVQLIDSFVESRLFEVQMPGSPLRPAYEEYQRRIINRNFVRLIADFDVPPDMDFSVFSPDEIVAKTLLTYRELHETGEMSALSEPREGEDPLGFRELEPSAFRCKVQDFHQGSKREDPLRRVLFHSSKDPSRCDFFRSSEDVPPLTQKVFLFFDGGPHLHKDPLMRQLVTSFIRWARAEQLKGQTPPKENVAPAPGTPPVKTDGRRKSLVEVARLEHTPQRKMGRRLMVQSSCPDWLMDP